ncbi:protein-S-isoprenylcysteine carboxyl O-methyltransferase PWA37_001463 [Arxiozyma heterogenica]|uniref:protein-S-isoprenylcysteine carboxyl O-methyltransferase n=1 Tax=Arxiozyma heterogenica TaxID=278026 RepID=UPI002EE35C0D
MENSSKICQHCTNDIYPDIRDNVPHEIAETSFGLGILFGVALGSIPFLQFKPFNLYILSLALFHFLEYYITAKYNPKKVNSQSFLLNNGIEYTMAHVVAVLEFLLEGYFCPKLKAYNSSKFCQVFTVIGIISVVVGQLIRSLAMYTAGKSFSHNIKIKKEKDHTLVTHGVYSWLRHPSYFGFYLWALGTQLTLLNPITFIGFCIVLHQFFSRRISFEERHLLDFFGQDYVKYKQSVKIWIPFM